MNQELDNFIKDYINLLREKYEIALIKSQKSDLEVDAAFHQGASFTYYDALDLLKSQLEAFGYDIEKLEPIVPELGKTIEKIV